MGIALRLGLSEADRDDPQRAGVRPTITVEMSISYGCDAAIGVQTMALDFAGKVVLVTGGGTGIGRASRRAFAAAGARVAVIDRDAAAATQVAGEIGGTATGHALDVSDGAAFAQLANEIGTSAGGIDVLV